MRGDIAFNLAVIMYESIAIGFICGEVAGAVIEGQLQCGIAIFYGQRLACKIEGVIGGNGRIAFDRFAIAHHIIAIGVAGRNRREYYFA